MPDEIGKPAMRPADTGNLTWHFTMKNTRDVAWAASKGTGMGCGKSQSAFGPKSDCHVSLSAGKHGRYSLVKIHGILKKQYGNLFKKFF